MAEPYAGGSCEPGDLYLAVSGALLKYSVSTKQITEIPTQDWAMDAIAVTADGYLYFVERDVPTAAKIHRIDLATGAEVVFNGSKPLTNGYWYAAAVNPQNGILYYADYEGRLYAFDTTTDSPLGFVGRLQPSVSGSGDIAFDPEGNLYSYWENSGSITRVAAANVPVTAQQTTKTLATTAVGTGYSPYSSGLAWMSSESSRPLWSTHYTYQNRQIEGHTPGENDKATVLTLPSFSGYIYDMASCPSAASATARLSLAKNVVGRATGSDQFMLRIEQPAGTVLASSTTSGSAVGKQSALAEVAEATRGATYTLREVGAQGTDLGRYTSSLECRDAATSAVIPTSGSGGVHTVTYPAEGAANVACTFTNLPPATLTVTKQLPGGRFAASDQFTVELREGDASGAIVDTPGNETTEGQGTTVTAGTGTTGTYEVKAATQYTITERGEAGVDLTNYTPSITCADPTGLQDGLPSNAPFDPAAGRSLTLEPGAQVSCVIRNFTAGASIGVGEGLTCEAGFVYAIASTNPSPGSSSGTGALVDSHGYVYKVNTATGEAVPALYDEFGSAAELPNRWQGTLYSGRVNALAVSQGGLYSYYSTQRTSSAEPHGLPVFRQDNKTGVTTRLFVMGIPSTVQRNGLASAASTVRGGINPTDGIYWISASTDDTNHHFWAYNTLTGQNYGYVGYLTGPVGGNGDLVFDQDGNMLLVSSTGASSGGAGQLWRVENLTAALAGAPRSSSTSIDSFVTKAKLTDLETAGQFNGVSFDNDGYLYVSFSDTEGNSRIQKLDPNTGSAVAAPLTVSGLNNPSPYSRTVVDLADCNDPGGLRLQKDYSGRVAGTDNVKLEITKQGVSASLVGGTATTDGPATGLQDKSAGVIIGVPGGTYVLTETATSGALANYTTSLSCVDKTHGNADVPVRKVSQGRYELDFPSVGPADGELLANVVCTYVNTPNGTLELEKRLASERADDADQFQVRIRTGGQNVETATTSGTGSTVTDGVTETVRAQTGADGVLTYTFDELGWRNGAESASVLESYPSPTLTCADATGLQPEEDLPYELALEDFEGIAPVTGSQISCVITNNASAARIAVEKRGSAQCLAPGADPTPVTYTYQVTSIGQEPLKDVELTDDKGAPVYVSGDSNEDGILTADETWLYEMKSSLTEPTTNVAEASAVGVDSGNKTSARGTWSVGEPSALEVTKTSSANGATVKAGDELTYTVTVTNTSDDDATKIALTDALPAGVSYVPASARKTYWTGSDTPGGALTGTWTATLPDFGFQAKSTVQTFSTVGQVPAEAQLTSYSITLKGSSAHQKNDVAVIGYLPGQTPGTTEPGTTGASAVPTVQRWFYLPYQQFGSGGGGTSGAGTWATKTMAAAASGTASGVFSLQWWDYQDSASHNPDNTASGVQVTLNYTYPEPSTERVQVTDAAHAPSELVSADDDITLQPGESMTVTFKVRVDDPLDPAITKLTNTAVAISEQDADCPAAGEVTDPVSRPLSLKCEAGYVYSIDDDGRLEEAHVDPETGLATVTGHSGWSSVDGSFNGLGVSSDGTTMYAYQIERVGSGPNGRDRIRVFSYDDGVFDPAPSDWFQPADQGQYFYFITGAVNPANGHYVFGGFTQDPTIGLVHRVYDYDPDTQEFSQLGYFLTGDAGMTTTRTNSDIAFDAAGNLYVLQSLPDEYGVNNPKTPVRIHTVTAANLAAAGGGAIPATATEWFDIVKATSGGGSTAEAVVGLAFDADGAAYLSTKTVLYRFNPATWEQLGEPQAVLTSSADLTSCNSPSTFTVKKDVVARLDGTDQFDLFAGKAETVFATATTAGGQTGIQPQQVGPVPVYSDGTVAYSFGEIIAEGSASTLSGYQTSWECTDSSGAVLSSGTGANGQVELNPTGLAVTCVLTNTPMRAFEVEKLGLNCDVGQPVCALEGAEFALYDADPATPGSAPLADGIAVNPDDLSRFVSIGLTVPGEYWLVETKAPRGFTLLATPIRFQLTADGIVLDSPGGATVQLKDGNAFILQITDATPAPLPKSGGDGPWPFLLVGLALFFGAGLAYHRSSRPRVRPMRAAS